MEMGLMESAKQAAIAGGGVTFLSSWAIGPELEHGALVAVTVQGFRVLRDFHTVRSKTRVLCARRKRCSPSSASSTRRPLSPPPSRASGSAGDTPSPASPFSRPRPGDIGRPLC